MDIDNVGSFFKVKDLRFFWKNTIIIAETNKLWGEIKCNQTFPYLKKKIHPFHYIQSETNTTEIKHIQKLKMADPILASITYLKIKKYIFVSQTLMIKIL